MSTFLDKLPNPVNLVGGDYEVIKTPTILARRMVDVFPSHVWSNKNLKWLVPVSKNGVYELRIYMQLMRGLKDVIPNQEERREWIVSNMIYSFALTNACKFLIQRNYLGKVWNDMRNFQTLRGNVQTRDFLKVSLGSNGEVMINQDVDNKKTYVKFDCIVGNPPYQDNTNIRNPNNIYHLFVLKAIECDPRYISMVIPARWMGGSGRNIGSFPKTMINCNKLSSMFVEKDAGIYFPDVGIKGGIVYFLYDRDHNSSIVNINGTDLDIKGEECIVTDTIGLSIRAKIFAKYDRTFDNVVSGTMPFGIKSNHKDWSGNVNDYVCHCRGLSGTSKSNYIAREYVIKHSEWIAKYKVCTQKAAGKGFDGMTDPIVIGPNHIVSGTYIVLFVCNLEQEANNVASFFRTHFAQYLISLLKNTQDVVTRVFKWLPVLDFTKSYIDIDLYTMFGLSVEEIAHIENTTKDFSIFKKMVNDTSSVLQSMVG